MISSTARMRILLVTPVFLPSPTGAAVYFDTLSQALLRQAPAARVVILTRTVAGAPRLERRGAVRVLRRLPPTGADRTRTGERAAAVATSVGILLASVALRSDVVHYHTLVAYRVLHRLAPLFRAPLVGDMRDLAAWHERAWLGNYRHCRRLICASENIRDFLLAGGFPSERLVHVPIPLVRPTPAPPETVAATRRRYGLPEAPYLLFVGAIIPDKGVAELLAAMELVWARRPEVHLALAGPLTPEGDALFPGGFRARVAGEARLHDLGPVAHADVLRLLQGAEMLVLPSRSEGLPRVGLEALALGRKAVLPPGIPEFQRACPEAVLAAITPAAIAAHIAHTWTATAPTYPLERHDADRVAALTLAVYRAAGA
jgi:glycosyltransferase involved in cell wall biosynthesis